MSRLVTIVLEWLLLICRAKELQVRVLSYSQMPVTFYSVVLRSPRLYTDNAVICAGHLRRSPGFFLLIIVQRDAILYRSDTSPFRSRRQEQPEDLPTEKTPTPVYEQQWTPNTIQTTIMICNAKGIPNAIAQKTVRQN